MQITRTPQRNDATLDYSVDGDVLTINGEAFDFSEIPDGGYVERVPTPWIAGWVWRLNGEIELTLIEPYVLPQVEAPDVES